MNGGTGFDTTPQRSPLTEYPSIHSFSFAVLVSTVIVVIPPLPGDTDRGKPCLFLFWLPNGSPDS